MNRRRQVECPFCFSHADNVAPVVPVKEAAREPVREPVREPEREPVTAAKSPVAPETKPVVEPQPTVHVDLVPPGCLFLTLLVLLCKSESEHRACA